ncbi:MAG: DUF3299 domain-containing protein [bacterium]|nr:DUF3299 domain-containing protein [bacterium]
MRASITIVLLACACADAPDAAPDATPREISFLDLSLEGVDAQALLEAYSAGQTATVPAALPDRLAALDGERVTLRGYVIPHAIQGSETTEFMLVRDLGDCCFGGVPGPDEWIAVKMAADTHAPYGRFTPTLVTGELHLGGDRGDLHWTPGVYRMSGESAELDP